MSRPPGDGAPIRRLRTGVLNCSATFVWWSNCLCRASVADSMSFPKSSMDSSGLALSRSSWVYPSWDVSLMKLKKGVRLRAKKP